VINEDAEIDHASLSDDEYLLIEALEIKQAKNKEA
jgi:hypothetical protein